MNFNKHYDLEGQHAFLGASKYHWVNYDDDRLDASYRTFLAHQKGTRLHDFACECILLGIKLPKNKSTLNAYINDAIGFRMTPEQPLYFSVNSFGTTDAISFKNHFLRIHDLKTGVTPASVHQLEVYAALFCLEYRENPEEIGMELRLYQSNDIIVYVPAPEEIRKVMNKIIAFDKRIENLKTGD